MVDGVTTVLELAAVVCLTAGMGLVAWALVGGLLGAGVGLLVCAMVLGCSSWAVLAFAGRGGSGADAL